MDSKFLHKLVDNGFKLKFQGDTCLIATANSTDTANGTTPAPVVKIKLPISLGVRYYPNQNKTTNVFAPKHPPRVKINNINQKFDTMEEYRDFLYERYDEAIERIKEQRGEKIDKRLDKNEALKDAQEDVRKRMAAPQRIVTPTEEAWLSAQRAAEEKQERLRKQIKEKREKKQRMAEEKSKDTNSDTSSDRDNVAKKDGK